MRPTCAVVDWLSHAVHAQHNPRQIKVQHSCHARKSLRSTAPASPCSLTFHLCLSGTALHRAWTYLEVLFDLHLLIWGVPAGGIRQRPLSVPGSLVALVNAHIMDCAQHSGIPSRAMRQHAARAAVCSTMSMSMLSLTIGRGCRPAPGTWSSGCCSWRLS